MEAFLVVIPKEEHPTSMQTFRPLSLCNVPIKFVSKMVVHWLKPLLKDLITPNQASFIPGRHITDNIIICQEIVHSLRYTKAIKRGMIMKLDLEKAYDRMEWSFIEEMLHDVALPVSLINVIMGSIRSNSCRILWNGGMSEYNSTD